MLVLKFRGFSSYRYDDFVRKIELLTGQNIVWEVDIANREISSTSIPASDIPQMAGDLLGTISVSLGEDEEITAWITERDRIEWTMLGTTNTFLRSIGGLALVFSEQLTPKQVTGTLLALANFYRSVGGLGFDISFEYQDIESKVHVHA